MEIMRHKGIRVHVGCGGEVVRGRCLRCGEREEKGSLGKKLLGEGPLIIKNKDIEAANRQAHRERIRGGRDIGG